MWFKDDNDGAKAIEGLKDKYSLADGKGSDAVLKKYQVSRLDRRGYYIENCAWFGSVQLPGRLARCPFVVAVACTRRMARQHL